MNTSRPLISIIIPAYNCENSVRKCVESLLKQSWQNREIIFIDDGSTDSTPLILDEYPEITVFKTKNRGPSHARNLGIERCHGDYIAFTDSDCIAEPDWLEELYKGFEKFPDSPVAGVGGDQKSPPDDSRFGKRVHEFLKSVGFVGEYVKAGRKMKETRHNPTCNVMYRKKDLVKSGGFNEYLWPGEDVEIDLTLSRLGYIHLFNPDAVVYHYRPNAWSGFYRMMDRYGWAQGYLVNRYGIFRPLHFEPVLLILFFITIGVLIFNGMHKSAIVFTSVSALTAIIIPFIYFYLKSWNLKNSFTFYAFFWILLFSWNKGFLKGILRKKR